MADEHRTITALTTRHQQQPDGISRRLQKTLDEARQVTQLARELGQVLVGQTANPEGYRARDVGTDSRGIFATIDAQAGEIEKELAEIRTVFSNIKRQL